MSAPVPIMTDYFIPPADEREIRTYLRIGGSVGAKSCDGPMLDRLELYAYQTEPCTKCGGSVADDRLGSGTVFSDTRVRDRRWRALLATNKSLGLKPPKESELIGDTTCTDCRGMGWVTKERRRHDVNVVPTARPTGNSRDPWTGRREPDPGTLATLAFVSRRLRAMGSPHAEVLMSYYMPTAIAETLRAVWPLTDAGRAMLQSEAVTRETVPHDGRMITTYRAMRDAGDLGNAEIFRRAHAETIKSECLAEGHEEPPQRRVYGAWDLVQTLVRSQARKAVSGRAAQFRAADEQAEKMLSAARVAWVEAKR